MGRVLAVYPFASQVLSITDPGFAAGVESQKNHIHGVLKGLGNGTTKVDYVPAGQKVAVGELTGQPFDPFVPDTLASNGSLHPVLLEAFRQGL